MPSASNAEEAKWNFALWLQNELEFIGERQTEAAQLLQEPLKARHVLACVRFGPIVLKNSPPVLGVSPKNLLRHRKLVHGAA